VSLGDHLINALRLPHNDVRYLVDHMDDAARLGLALEYVGEADGIDMVGVLVEQTPDECPGGACRFGERRGDAAGVGEANDTAASKPKGGQDRIAYLLAGFQKSAED
jgi:hypothetical protein